MVELRVVGFDLSLRATGVADVDGSLHTIKTKKLRGVERLSYIECYLTPFILRADLVVIEGYSFGSKGRATFNIGELGGVIRLACHRAHTSVLECPPTVVKKLATGKGNASKDEVLAAAIEDGAKPTNYDESDAYWLRKWGQEQHERV